jgi:hypothetical protein
MTKRQHTMLFIKNSDLNAELKMKFINEMSVLNWKGSALKCATFYVLNTSGNCWKMKHFKVICNKMNGDKHGMFCNLSYQNDNWLKNYMKKGK